MNIEVLVSTMDREDLTFLDKMNIKENSIIINQSNEKKIQKGYKNTKIINCQEYGLSKSRNKAIENSTADICIIADDDLIYENNFYKNIEDIYFKYPNYDIIAFFVENDDYSRKKEKMRERKIGYLYSMKLQSVQITFKRESILEKKIKFDETFGAGTEKYMGEENIFLIDCLKEGLKIYYVPITIAHLTEGPSSWFKGYNEEYLSIKGQAYKRMFGKILGAFFSGVFVIRHYGLFKNEICFLKAMNIIIKNTLTNGK